VLVPRREKKLIPASRLICYRLYYAVSRTFLISPDDVGSDGGVET
jgi:hypothetical protein